MVNKKFWGETLPVNITFVALMILSRLIPHPPDLTPTIVLSILLRECSFRFSALLCVVAGQAISDILLGFLYHYPMWGSWSLFTYSGLLFAVLFFRFNFTQLFLATFLFWVWTNFGVFLLSGLYLHTQEAFIQCYIFAFPFLGFSLLGTLFYYALIRVLALDSERLNRVFSTAL